MKIKFGYFLVIQAWNTLLVLKNNLSSGRRQISSNNEGQELGPAVGSACERVEISSVCMGNLGLCPTHVHVADEGKPTTSSQITTVWDSRGCRPNSEAPWGLRPSNPDVSWTNFCGTVTSQAR